MVMKARGAIMLVGVILSVPTSMFAAELAMGKFAKQLINCGEDASNSLIAFDPLNSTNSDYEMHNIATSLSACKNNADIRKGNIAFVREEMARANAGR